MSITSFADVEITKDWNDDLTGNSAKGRSVPSVTLTGEASYEKLLNMMWPVGSEYTSYDSNFDPNSAWGGEWTKTVDGEEIETRKLLWTNSNPKTSFAAQTLSMDLSQYDEVGIYFTAWSNDFRITTYSKTIKGRAVVALQPLATQTGYNDSPTNVTPFSQQVDVCMRSWCFTDNGITFGTAVEGYPGSSWLYTSSSNHTTIPYKIYGLKHIKSYKWHRTA